MKLFPVYTCFAMLRDTRQLLYPVVRLRYWVHSPVHIREEKLKIDIAVNKII